MGFMGKFSLFGNSSSKATKTSQTESASPESNGGKAAKAGQSQIPPILGQTAPTFNAPEPSGASGMNRATPGPQGATNGGQIPPSIKAMPDELGPTGPGAAANASVMGGSSPTEEKSPIDSMEADLTELLVAIKSQVDSERLRIAENRDSPGRERENLLYSGPIINGVSAALNTYQKEAKARTLSDDSQIDRLRAALTDVTQAMETLVSALPDPGIGDGGWNTILAELEGLSERQRRLDEIQKAFDATMKEVEEGFVRIEQHIQASIRQEQGSIETLQKRIKMAEGLARLLKR